MGFLGIGDSSHKRVTPKELEKDIMRELANGGDPNTRFTHHERQKVEQFLKPLMNDSDMHQKGLSAKEAENALKALREHPHHFVSSSKKLDRLEKDINEELRES